MSRSAVLSILLLISVFSCTNYDAGRYPLTHRTVDIMISRADSLLRIGEIDSAKSLYAATTSDSGRNLRALTGLGKAALAGREWAEALSFAEEAIAVDSGSFPGHYIAAVAQRELGAFAFREPGFNGPSQHGDWGRSRKHFGWILARDSSYEDVLYQFALLLRYEGDRDGALDMDSSQIVRKPELLGPQVGRYGLFRYFMFTEDSTEFVRWLEGLPGSMPRYFRAETFRRHGNFAAAESLLISLLKAPGDVSLQAVRIALSRVRFAQGDRSAAEAEYWKGVNEVHTRLGSAILFEDLRYVVSDGELTYFNSLDSVSRQRDFFRSFWNFRNPSPALKTNLRIQEHIRRFLHAEKTFEYYGARTQFNNPDRLRELRFPRAFTLNDEFNDMGMIYMRQGDPDDIVRHDSSPSDEEALGGRPPTKIFSGPGTKPRDEQVHDQEVFERKYQAQRPYGYAHDSFESWLFNGTSESPRMIFNFQKHNAVGSNWRLVAVPALDAMIDELGMWDSKYQRLYTGTESDRAPLQAQMTVEARGAVNYALSTERQTWEKKTETFRFPHAIDVFRAPDGRCLLDISYAIPIAPLTQSLPDSIRSVPVEVGFSLIDAKSQKSVTQLDTPTVGLVRTRTGVIVDLIRYTVPPDSYSVSMHMRPLSGDMLGNWRQTLRVLDFSRPGLMMSSVQFLRPSTQKGSLEINGVKVVQSPFRTHVRTEPLLVYFQIYHLIPDGNGNTSYATECSLLPSGEPDLDRGIVIHRNQQIGKEEMAVEFYQIDVNSVDSGRYKLIMKVTDRKRVQTLVGAREIEIVKP